MKIKAIIAVFAIAVSAMAWSTAQAGSAKAPDDATPPDGVDILSGDEIVAAFTENTIFGRDAGKKYYEFFKPNGIVRGVWDRDKYKAKWSVQNDMLCMDYKGTGYDGCWYIEIIDGNKTSWYFPDGTPDGEPGAYELLEGNPKNL